MKRQLTRIALGAWLCLAIGGNVSAAEAKRPKVRSVTFSGNAAYEAARLEGLMLTRPSRFLATNRYHPDVFLDDLETLLSFYRQNGYLQASIIDTTVDVDSLENRVDVAIALDEGVRTLVEGVTVFGNSFFADTLLTRLVGFSRDDPLRRPVIEDAVVSFLSLYAEQGFLDASVTPQAKVNDTAHLALVDFVISEGVSSRVGEIDISGNHRSQPHVIMRELSFAPGDTIRYSKLIGSQRRLYLTGLFESVFVRPLPGMEGNLSERTILVEVKEKPSSELSFSLGYGTIEKFRGRMELNTFNLAGTARKAGLGLEANFIKQGATLSFSEPWTFGTRWKTDLSLLGQFRQEPAYHAEVLGGKLTVGRKIGAYTTLAGTYRLENTNLSKIDLAAPHEELDPRLRSLSLNLSYDSRDNLFDPSVGWYANWSNEIAGGFLHGSDSFAKSVLVIKKFQPVGRFTVFASALEIGWARAFGESEEISLGERFYTGGPTSLRGFGYQMVGPREANGEPQGGRFKLVWNFIELRRSLYKMIGAVLFLEFGNVWSAPKAVKLNDLRVDLGGGLRVNSPLGILRLDYGANLDRRHGEPAGRVFVSMGQAF